MNTMRFPLWVLVGYLLAGCTDLGGYFLESNQAAPVPTYEIGLSVPPEVDLKVAEDFVRIGYRLNEGQRFQSTEFLTPVLRTSQAVHLIRLVKAYNNFEGDRVAAEVAALQGRVSGVEFGREGSPVLYLHLPYWTHQREEFAGVKPGVKINEDEHAQLVREIQSKFSGDLKADEFSVKGGVIRLWWD